MGMAPASIPPSIRLGTQISTPASMAATESQLLRSSFVTRSRVLVSMFSFFAFLSDICLPLHNKNLSVRYKTAVIIELFTAEKQRKIPKNYNVIFGDFTMTLQV